MRGACQVLHWPGRGNGELKARVPVARRDLKEAGDPKSSTCAREALAVVHDAALGLEQKQVVQIDAGIDVADLAGAQRPLIEGSLAVQSAMGTLMVFAFEVGPQTAVEGVVSGGVRELSNWRRTVRKKRSIFPFPAG